MKQEHIKSE